jgi:hypothetical protein
MDGREETPDPIWEKKYCKLKFFYFNPNDRRILPEKSWVGHRVINFANPSSVVLGILFFIGCFILLQIFGGIFWIVVFFAMITNVFMSNKDKIDL